MPLKYLFICIFLYREFIKILLILQVMKWTELQVLDGNLRPLTHRPGLFAL